MNVCDNPFAGSFEMSLSDGRKVAYTGRGECGMGGPSRGKLSLDGRQIAWEALPSFCYEPMSTRFGYFEIDLLASPPRVRLIVVDATGRECLRDDLEFGAYSVRFLDASRIRVCDEYIQKAREVQIEDKARKS